MHVSSLLQGSDPTLPFASRESLMSLSTHPNRERPWANVPRASQQLSDRRSHPYYPWNARAAPSEKPAISGSTTRPIYPMACLNRPIDLSLTTEDIEGARAKRRAFTTNRCTNPLEPAYTLPTCYVPPPPAVPKKIGCLPTNFIGDIAGARPRLLSRARSSSVDNLNISDIEGTRPRTHLSPSLQRTKESNSLCVKDINASPTCPLKPRGTNPLEPVYNISSSNGFIGNATQTFPLSSETVGPITGSKPRVLYASKPSPLKDPVEKSHPQRYIGNIPHSSVGESLYRSECAMPTGSRAGSLRRGVVSKRCTDPLFPTYEMLDGKHDSASNILLGSNMN